MIPPALALEIETRLTGGQGVREISADLAIPTTDVQQVRDRMVATAAPRDHRLDSLLEMGESSPHAATRRLAARCRTLVTDLRSRVVAEARERELIAEVDRLSAALLAARESLRIERAR